MSDNTKKYSRRTVALFWSLIVIVIFGTLIYIERIDLLYVLTTLSLMALLLIVGFADLERVGRENAEGFSKNQN